MPGYTSKRSRRRAAGVAQAMAPLPTRKVVDNSTDPNGHAVRVLECGHTAPTSEDISGGRAMRCHLCPPGS